MAEPLLKIQSISAGYGPIEAIRDVSLEVFPGEIVTLIGSNGAGKTPFVELTLAPLLPGSVIH